MGDVCDWPARSSSAVSTRACAGTGWRRSGRGAGEVLAGAAQLEPLELWRGLRPCTPDGLPIIGRSPRHDNLVVAAGHCMLGLGLGP